MITKSLLSKIIKTGNLTWVMPNGEINTYGDGTGDPIKIRTTNNFSEIKLLMNPSIHSVSYTHLTLPTIYSV